jgi:hypothetical protein
VPYHLPLYVTIIRGVKKPSLPWRRARRENSPAVTIGRQVRGEQRKGLHEGAPAELGPKMPVPQPELGNEDLFVKEGRWRRIICQFLPQTANGRPGFHEPTILLLRQDMAAGTLLPVFSAPPCLPCLPYFRQDLGKQQTSEQRVKIVYLRRHPLSRHG